MLVPELKSSQRHPPSPKEVGETEVKSRDRENDHIWIKVFAQVVRHTTRNLGLLIIFPGYFKESGKSPGSFGVTVVSF